MEETDNFSFFKGFMKKTEEMFSERETSPAPSPFSDTYNMSHRNRGVAVIFNQVNFANPEWRRDGSNKDRDDLVEMLHELDFNVLIHDDLTSVEVKDVLLIVSKMDHSESDCLVLVVMSHGDSEKVYAQDQHYPTSTLWESFSATRCPSLAGKPKLFFIQACRGTGLHEGVNLIATSDEIDAKPKSPSYSIPVMADILIMYSTMDGYYSWRDPIEGGYFIQSLVKQIKLHYKTKDLLTILTFVNRDVAINFTSNEPNLPMFSGMKQMCSIVSMLTRQLFF